MEYSYCTVSVKVGRDTIEDAVFFKLDEDAIDVTDERVIYRVIRRWSFGRIEQAVRDIYWNIMYGFQRMFRGYDDRDVFSVDAMFIRRYTKILTDFKKTHHSYPGYMTDEQWVEIIDDMLYHLEYMDEDKVNDELMNAVGEDWIPTIPTTNRIVEIHTTEFFALFSKYFHSLWS